MTDRMMGREIQSGPAITTGEAGGRRVRPGVVRSTSGISQNDPEDLEAAAFLERLEEKPVHLTITSLAVREAGAATDTEIREKLRAAGIGWKSEEESGDYDSALEWTAVHALEACTACMAAMEDDGEWVVQARSGTGWRDDKIALVWIRGNADEEHFGKIPEAIMGKPYLRAQAKLAAQHGPAGHTAKIRLEVKLAEEIELRKNLLHELAEDQREDQEDWRAAAREEALMVVHDCLMHQIVVRALTGDRGEAQTRGIAGLEVRRIAGDEEPLWSTRDLFPDINVNALGRTAKGKPRDPKRERYSAPPERAGRKRDGWIQRTARQVSRGMSHVVIDPQWHGTEIGQRLIEAIRYTGTEVIEGIDPGAGLLATVCGGCGWTRDRAAGERCGRCGETANDETQRTQLLGVLAADWLGQRAAHNEDLTLERYLEETADEIAREGGAPWRIRDEGEESYIE